MSRNHHIRRREAIAGLAAMTFATPFGAFAQTTPPIRRNIMGFRSYDWRDYFDNLGKGILLADTTARTMHHWTPDGALKVYPTSVPLTDELTRRGYSEIVFKDDAPDWTPTPSMRERDPDLPAYVPPGPDNPLGARSMHLTWQYYRIHGTQDTRKIGRQSSNGCIGLYNEDIIEVFDRTEVGAQVLLL